MAPAPSRAANVSAYQDDSAVTALQKAKPRRVPVSTRRRGSPRSAAVRGTAARKEASA
ncbi:hypothetical protein ACGFY3_30590 [Streptomyces mirabilis]|uniref:hypothetical protein n=1 Tax=Streptomyces mirabilis TaxID=68239 RepID=UPI0037183768